MKSSLFVLCALFASCSAITSLPNDEMVDLQIGVEAQARSNIREMLKSNLRKALESTETSDVPEVTALQVGVSRGDSWPGPILPGADPIMPIGGSSNPMVFEETFVQVADDDMPSVEEARQQAAQMQAQMDQAVADADAKRADQQAQYEENIKKDDPAGQLQGLMNAQASLHRLTSAFSAKPNLDKVSGMAQKLGIPMTPELMQLGTNEAISNALVEIAVGMGKTEQEISAALTD